MMGKMSAIDWTGLILIIVGAINWGLVGLFNFDLVAAIFGNMTLISRVIYILIGVAGVWKIYHLYRSMKS